MVEADAPIASASSRIEAAPSRRRRSRIMARRLAGMISTRFDGVSMMCIPRHSLCRPALPAKHHEAPAGKAVAEADGRPGMRQMRRGAGYEGERAIPSRWGNGRIAEPRLGIDVCRIGGYAVSSPGARQKTAHHESASLRLGISTCNGGCPVIGMHTDTGKAEPLAQ